MSWPILHEKYLARANDAMTSANRSLLLILTRFLVQEAQMKPLKHMHGLQRSFFVPEKDVVLE